MKTHCDARLPQNNKFQIPVNPSVSFTCPVQAKDSQREMHQDHGHDRTLETSLSISLGFISNFNGKQENKSFDPFTEMQSNWFIFIPLILIFQVWGIRCWLKLNLKRYILMQLCNKHCDHLCQKSDHTWNNLLIPFDANGVKLSHSEKYNSV